MTYLLSTLNAADKLAVIETNFERIDTLLTRVAAQDIEFSSETQIVSGSYLGGRYRWPVDVAGVSASLTCDAPTGADQSFTLEVDGELTDQVLTVAAGATEAQMTLTGITVTTGQYLRWKCTAAPADPANCASNIVITTAIRIALTPL